MTGEHHERSASKLRECHVSICGSNKNLIKASVIGTHMNMKIGNSRLILYSRSIQKNTQMISITGNLKLFLGLGSNAQYEETFQGVYMQTLVVFQKSDRKLIATFEFNTIVTEMKALVIPGISYLVSSKKNIFYTAPSGEVFVKRFDEPFGTRKE
jgi:hypothetical protein